MRGIQALYIPFATHDALTVVITSPTQGQVVTDANLKITWTTNTVDQQATYRLRIYSDAALTNLVYDSGLINSSTQLASVPFPGLLMPGATYYVVVYATDTFGLQGTSSAVSFLASWATTTTVGNLRYETIGGCLDPKSLPGIRIRWAAPTLGSQTFVNFEVYRREPTVETLYTRMAIISNLATLFFDDFEVKSGSVYQYYVSWTASVGIETHASGPSSYVYPQVVFDHFWIHDKVAPTQCVRFDSFDAQITVSQQVSFQRTWGSQQPVMRIGDQYSRIATIPALPQLLNDRIPWDNIQNLVARQRNNSSLLVARWGKGKEMMYCQVGASQKSQHQGDYEQSIELVEVRHTTGV